MSSPRDKPENPNQSDIFNCSIDDDDLLENIKPNFISFSLSDSYSTHFSSDVKTISEGESDNRKDESEDSHNEDGESLASSADAFMLLLENPAESISFERKIDRKKDSEESITHSVLLSLNDHMLEYESIGDFGTDAKCSPEIDAHVEKENNLMNVEKIPATSNCGVISNTNALVTKHRLSSSLHDLSALPSFPLQSKSQISMGAIQSQSMMSVSSAPKSKDSGFTRSLSCLSLNSSGKNYSHIQSKVKDYIKQIKEESATRRKRRFVENTMKQMIGRDRNIIESQGCDTVCDDIIDKLEKELENKDNTLLAMQESYNSLLNKLATAENRIDILRFKVMACSDRESASNVGESTNMIPRFTSPVVHKPSLSMVQHPKQNPATETVSSELTKENQVPFLCKDSVPYFGTWSDINGKHSHSRKSANQADVKSIVSLGEEQIVSKSLLNPQPSNIKTNIGSFECLQNGNYPEFSEEIQEGYDHQLQLLNPKRKITCNLSRVEKKSVLDSISSQSKQKASSYCTGIAGKVETAVSDHITSCTKGQNDGDMQIKMAQSKETVLFKNDEKINVMFADKSFVQSEQLKKTNRNVSDENFFVKVKRWQNSLPPLEVIEPSCYGSLEGNASRSKKSSRCHTTGPQVKKHRFICRSGGDSGHPHSEPYNVTKQMKQFDLHKRGSQDRENHLSIASNRIKDAAHVKAGTDSSFQFFSEPSAPCPSNMFVNLNGDKQQLSESDLAAPIILSNVACSECEVRVSTPLNCPKNFQIFTNVNNTAQESNLLTDKSDNSIIAGHFYGEACECWGDGNVFEYSKINYDSVKSHVINHTPDTCIVPPLKLDYLSGVTTAIQSPKTSSNIEDVRLHKANHNEGCIHCHNHISISEVAYTPSSSVSSTALHSEEKSNHFQKHKNISTNYSCSKAYNQSNQTWSSAHFSYNIKMLNKQGQGDNDRYIIGENNVKNNFSDSNISPISMNTPTSYKTIQRHKASAIENQVLQCSDTKVDESCDLKKNDTLFHKDITSNFTVHNTVSTFNSSQSLKPKRGKRITSKESNISTRKLLGQHMRNVLLKLVQNGDTKPDFKCTFNRNSFHVDGAGKEHIETVNDVSDDDACVSINQIHHPNEENIEENVYKSIAMHRRSENMDEESYKAEHTGTILSSEDCNSRFPSSQRKEKEANANLMKKLEESELISKEIKERCDGIIHFLSEQLDSSRNVST